MDDFPLEEIARQAGSRYAVVTAAAQRAKQIRDGSPPLVNIPSRNPLTIALAEIAAGKVILLPPEPQEEEVRGRRDEYFVGREDLKEDDLLYRRSSRASARRQLTELDELEEEEDEDEEDLDEDEDEDDLLDEDLE